LKKYGQEEEKVVAARTCCCYTGKLISSISSNIPKLTRKRRARKSRRRK
jgi:hypothetical protein